MEATSRGSYLGTEIAGKWWRRYRARGFFSRGNGELWLDEEGLHFRRLLTRSPLDIAWREISGIRLGRWHSGRWAAGQPVLKLDFERDGKQLSAGFVLARDWQQMEELADELRGRIQSA
jgi:hypothetical protein